MQTTLQITSSYSSREYSEFKENSNAIFNIPSPIVGLLPDTITIIDQEQTITLKDSTFNFNDHDYFVIDLYKTLIQLKQK